MSQQRIPSTSALSRCQIQRRVNCDRVRRGPSQSCKEGLSVSAWDADNSSSAHLKLTR